MYGRRSWKDLRHGCRLWTTILRLLAVYSPNKGSGGLFPAAASIVSPWYEEWHEIRTTSAQPAWRTDLLLLVQITTHALHNNSLLTVSQQMGMHFGHPTS